MGKKEKEHTLSLIGNMGKRWEWINGVQSVWDVKSRFVRLEQGTDCESCV